MEIVTRFSGSLVAIDTSPFIYLMERHPHYSRLVIPFFQALDRGTFRAVTSVITVTECLVLPTRLKNWRLVSTYRDVLLGSPNLRVAPVTRSIAERAAILRAKYSFGPPQALQIATALDQGAGMFVTNDRRLQMVKELPVLMLEDL